MTVTIPRWVFFSMAMCVGWTIADILGSLILAVGR